MKHLILVFLTTIFFQMNAFAQDKSDIMLKCYVRLMSLDSQRTKGAQITGHAFDQYAVIPKKDGTGFYFIDPFENPPAHAIQFPLNQKKSAFAYTITIDGDFSPVSGNMWHSDTAVFDVAKGEGNSKVKMRFLATSWNDHRMADPEEDALMSRSIQVNMNPHQLSSIGAKPTHDSEMKDAIASDLRALILKTSETPESDYGVQSQFMRNKIALEQCLNEVKNGSDSELIGLLKAGMDTLNKNASNAKTPSNANSSPAVEKKH